MKSIFPAATLGILGGGQLGRMFTLEAKRLGYRVITLEPSSDSPCGQVADAQIEAAYNDKKALQELAEQCDVITYEFENIDAEAVEYLESLHKPVYPSSKVLKTTQNRIREKAFLREAGIPVADFQLVRTQADFAKALAEIGCPAILKTADGGYDGKGQRVMDNAEEALAAFLALQGCDLIWEKKIPFVKELSVLCARGRDGKSVCYPTGENRHVKNILDVTLVPARITNVTENNARDIALKIAQSLDIIGLFCVELFCLADGSLLVNEIAPRPHNSGHYTLDACQCSQFEQQVRAICGLPLGNTSLFRPAAMMNILGNGQGNYLQGIDSLLAQSDLSLHLYGKSEAKAARKMGHFTALGETLEDALAQAEIARKNLVWSNQSPLKK